MIPLSDQQQAAVEELGNVFIQACPGSGKTRVLTCRVIRGLQLLKSPKHRVVALTFTNRAADEIQVRLDRLAVNQDRLWAGTIHSFALEWILRPYAGYQDRTRRGFSIADEYYTAKVLESLRRDFGKPFHFKVRTARGRDGAVVKQDEIANLICEQYRDLLHEGKLLDYDDVLYYSYRLLVDRPEIARTLSAILRVICVDEIQDTQDLQFGILSAIFGASQEHPDLFLVGDLDQCIYENLGAVPKSVEELSQEFGGADIKPLSLTGNYRSTQRMIQFYQLFRPNTPHIDSLTTYAREPGIITFFNQTVERDEIPRVVAQLVLDALGRGVPTSEICVLAPHWTHVRSISRALIRLLPEVDFDLLGSPLHSQRDNIWFGLARLFLTTPTPQLYRTRLRWAAEVLRTLQDVYHITVSERIQSARQLLRFMNSIEATTDDGLEFLERAFDELCAGLEIDVTSITPLADAREHFFAKARERIDADDAPRDLSSFKKLFKHPSGITISTCHGVKGEEYDTVIAFGMLRGYLPNWDEIFSVGDAIAEDRAARLLYVICSRAKRVLHLIAEFGRLTQKRKPLETTAHLAALHFDYDEP